VPEPTKEPRADVCRGPRCGKTIYWRQSPTTNRWIPFDDPGGAVSHWSSCVDSMMFRKKKTPAPAKQTSLEV